MHTVPVCFPAHTEIIPRPFIPCHIPCVEAQCLRFGGGLEFQSLASRQSSCKR